MTDACAGRAPAQNQTGPQGPAGATGPAGPEGPAGPSSLAALQGSPCTVGGHTSTLNVSVNSASGAVTMTCVPNYHIYWANNIGTIGRANPDGTGVNQSFISGASSPIGVAVSP